MKNSISDLRDHLFDVIERLKDPKKEAPMDCATAETICLAAQRLIETGELEVKYLDVIGGPHTGNEFLKVPLTEPQKKLAAKLDKPLNTFE